MRKHVIVLLLAFVFAVQAQYQVTSEYLKNPSKNIDLVLNQAEFWKNYEDANNGGWFCMVDGNGNLQYGGAGWEWVGNEKNICDWGWGDCSFLDELGYEYIDFTGQYYLKSVIGHSRVAYTFLRAFMLTGDESYLGLARKALDWMYEYGWNKETGGWWFSTDEYGKPTTILPSQWFNPNLFKWSYAQIYPLVGIAAMVEATGQTEGHDMGRLREGIELVDEKFYDTRPGYEGYYLTYPAGNALSYNWLSVPQDKGFTPTIDGITTNGSAGCLLIDKKQYTARFLAMADQAEQYLVGSMDNPAVKVGFASEFDSDWNINMGVTGTSIGHVLKTAWCLGRAYLFDAQEKYRAGAARLIRDVLENGYDHVNGGPYQGYNWAAGAVTVENKDQWMLEQAITSGLVNSYIAGNQDDRDAFLGMVDQTISFYMAHQVDWDNGGVYEVVSNDGSSIVDGTKGSVWEQGYHSSELGYFSYLYSSLLLNKSTATLYYMINKSKRPLRKVELNPIEAVGSLVIESVTLNGKPFTSFDASTRTLRIPRDVGGKFKVTFAMSDDAPGMKKSARVSSVASTVSPVDGTVSIAVPEGTAGATASVVIMDLFGRTVFSRTVDRTAASAAVTVPGRNLPAGLYILHVKSSDLNFSQKIRIGR